MKGEETLLLPTNFIYITIWYSCETLQGTIQSAKSLEILVFKGTISPYTTSYDL